MAHKNDDELSHLAATHIRAQRAELADQFAQVAAVVRGSLHRQARRCGKEGCRCGRGELHGPYVYLATRSGGRGRTVYVPTDLAEEIASRVQLNNRLAAALTEISALNLELLARGELD